MASFTKPISGWIKSAKPAIGPGVWEQRFSNCQNSQLKR